MFGLLVIDLTMNSSATITEPRPIFLPKKLFLRNSLSCVTECSIAIDAVLGCVGALVFPIVTEA